MTDQPNSDVHPAAAASLSLCDAACLTSGDDSWHLPKIPGQHCSGFSINDGPYGLRRPREDIHSAPSDETAATCFPPACGLASSWNPVLVEQVGRAIGEECLQERTAVILGPAVNIKRNPLGGRASSTGLRTRT